MSGGRRDAVLDAAIAVLGAGGARALTHRAVDRAAGVAEGTTSNYFRTRDALVRGVLGRVTLAESAPVVASGLSVDALVALAADRLHFMLGDGRTLALARHALFLEAAVRPDLQPAVVMASHFWWELGERLLAALDVPEPAARSRWLFAYLDGLLVDQLARPDPRFDPAAAVRAGLRGLLA